MKKLVLTGAVIAALVASCGTSDDEAATERAAPAKATATAAPEPARIRHKTRCDYLLDFDSEMNNRSRFVAGGELENVGGRPGTARVVVTWDRLGSKPVRVTRRYRLRAGQSRSFNVSRRASMADVDAHQSAEGACKVRVTLR